MATRDPIRQVYKAEIDKGPQTTALLCPNRDLRARGLFYKDIKILIRLGEITHYDWYLSWGSGHPDRVLSNHDIPREKLRHEVLVSYVLNALGYDYRRLYDVDQYILPDAELLRNGGVEYVELDTGSERGMKIEDRLSVYREAGNVVRWIVNSEERQWNLRQKDCNPRSYFAVFNAVLKDPHGKIWMDINNRLVTL